MTSNDPIVPGYSHKRHSIESLKEKIPVHTMSHMFTGSAENCCCVEYSTPFRKSTKAKDSLQRTETIPSVTVSTF